MLGTMVSGKFKSRSLRRVKVKTPGGRVITHYRERKPEKSKCGVCKGGLSGVPREIPSKIGKLSKSQRRPSRYAGGNLCSKCSRQNIKSNVIIEE